MKKIINFIKKDILKSEKDLDFILWNGGKGELGFISIIIYSKKKPILIVKFSRNDNEKIQLEYQNLIKINKIISKTDLKTTLEKPLILKEIDGKQILFKNYIDGFSAIKYISTFPRKRKIINFIGMVTSWYLDFLKETIHFRDNSIESKKKYLKQYNIESINNNYINDFLYSKELFLGASHGDFVLQNVFLKKKKITGIIDWESFSIKGIPLFDIFSIMLSIFENHYKSYEHLIKNFNKRNWLFKEIEKAFNKVCMELSIHLEDFYSILPIYSDRALYLAKIRKNSKLLNYHKKLKDKIQNLI